MIEVKSARQENSKTFRLPGGKYRTFVSSHPLHYWDGEKWEDVSGDYVQDGDTVIYPHLPQHIRIYPGGMDVAGKMEKYEAHISSKTDGKGEVRHLPLPGRIKTEYLIQSPADIPSLFRVMVTFSGLQVQEDYTVTHEDESGIRAGRLLLMTPRGRVALAIDQPVFIDAAGTEFIPGWKYNIGDGVLTIDVNIPRIWLTDSERLYPIVLDPVYDSINAVGMINITNQGTYSHTTPANIEISVRKCRWYGKSTFRTVTPSPYETSTWNAGSTSTSFPSVSNPTRCYLSASGRAQGTGQTYVTVTVKGYANGGLVAQNSNYVMRGQDVYAQTWLGAGYAGKSASVSATVSDGTTPATTIYVETYYMYQPAPYTVETKTANCAVSIFGVNTTGPSSVNNATWSSWYTLNGFKEGLNTFTFSIGGSGRAGFEFYYEYTYKKPTPIGYVKVRLSDGTTEDLIVAALNDPNLANKYVRVYMPWMEIGVADLVNIDDPERGHVRIMTPAGVKAWRRKTS